MTTPYKMRAWGPMPSKQMQKIISGISSVKPTLKRAGATAKPPGVAPPAVNPIQTAPVGYDGMIKGEGIYGQQNANSSAAGIADLARAKAAASALIAQYGGLPGGISDPFGIIDAGAGAAGANNPYSTLAQIDRSSKSNQANLVAERAARGTLPSGGTKLGLEDIGYQTGLAKTNAAQQFLSQINEIISGYTDAERQRQMDQQGYITDAAGRLIDAGFAPGSGQSGQTGGTIMSGARGPVKGGGEQVWRNGRWMPKYGPGGLFESPQAQAATIASNIAAGQADPWRYKSTPAEVAKGWIMPDPRDVAKAAAINARLRKARR